VETETLRDLLQLGDLLFLQRRDVHGEGHSPGVSPTGACAGRTGLTRERRETLGSAVEKSKKKGREGKVYAERSSKTTAYPCLAAVARFLSSLAVA
ncbi:MAG: hypothetical protein AAFX41_15370, partial [Bacteroidota bacterium]